MHLIVPCLPWINSGKGLSPRRSLVAMGHRAGPWDEWLGWGHGSQPCRGKGGRFLGKRGEKTCNGRGRDGSGPLRVAGAGAEWGSELCHPTKGEADSLEAALALRHAGECI